MAGQLEGTVAVITGAAHGQGRSTCGQGRKKAGGA
jgi:hypothetical protein